MPRSIKRRVARWARVLLFRASVEDFAALDRVDLCLGLAASRSVNAWFLAVVALWRVALLVFFLRRHARLTYPRLLVGAFLPLTSSWRA